MLIKDELTQARHIKSGAREDYADAVNRATYEELCRARLMDDQDLAPNNPARQMGRVLTPHQLEALIAKLGIPNLQAETHPTNPNKRCLYVIRGDAKQLVCVYENNPMPEFSIIQGVVKWVPDPAYLGEGGKTAMRADLEGAAAPVSNAQAAALIDKYGIRGALNELENRAPSHLGMKQIMVPGAEKVRGWRTVLAYLWNHGLTSPERVRQVVTDADRASWAGLTGARQGALAAWLR